MPQFDFANFVPQLAWLTLFFAILYFGIVRATLPKIGRVVDQRETMVKGDIATAETAKAEADRIRDGYEAAMTAARSGAQASVAAAKATAARAVEERLAQANQALDATAATAEAALSQARQAAMGEIERIAADAATDIVALISGRRPEFSGGDRSGTVGRGLIMDEPALPVVHTNAHSEVAEHDPTLLGLEAEGWVYVGLTIFLLIAIFVAKAPKRIADALDQRIADTRRELDEAKAIRAEAEALLAEAKTRQAAATKDAESILGHATVEAEQLVAQAQVDADALIARRGKMAEEKIAAAERGAIAEVRAQAAGTAAAAAALLIEQGHDANADKALVDRTIARLS